MTYRRIFLLSFLGSVLASCGGREPTGLPRTNDGPVMTRVIKTNPLFDPDIQNILVKAGCVSEGCHGEASNGQARLKLDFDVEMNYANLVNVPAFQQAGFLLVDPDDAINSYVMIKLDGRQSVGQRMPPGQSLDSIDLTNFRNWIDKGAQRE